jgi:hypothetical protein
LNTFHIRSRTELNRIIQYNLKYETIICIEGKKCIP